MLSNKEPCNVRFFAKPVYGEPAVATTFGASHLFPCVGFTLTANWTPICDPT